MRWLVPVLLSILLLSCRTKERIVEVPVETIRTEYKTNRIYDSIFVKDSVDRFIRGDTVFLYKEHSLIKYRDRVDTLIVRDTIPKLIKVETVKEVKVNVIHWWQEALMWLGGVLGLGLLITVIRKFK